MKETKETILKEYENWKNLYKDLINELKKNFELFHKNKITLYQSQSPEEYKDALFNLSVK